jgi:hypothetical protein
MYPYRGAIWFELFRTDFITLHGEMKCLESRWRKLPPKDGSSPAIRPGHSEVILPNGRASGPDEILGATRSEAYVDRVWAVDGLLGQQTRPTRAPRQALARACGAL